MIYKKPDINWVGSPNFDDRPIAATIDMIVLHVTACASLQSVLSWFGNEDSQVSAHYVIDQDGLIFQMVKDDKRAWHCRGVNSISIGIEFVGTGEKPSTQGQDVWGAELLNYLCSLHKLNIENIYGHRWAPGVETTKTCPGKLFGDTQQDLKAHWNMRLAEEFQR